ncbi:glycosyltransferase family 29 protein [Ciceribacter azotifigens]|uniref:glycosyltransferase family 29 protein n=1 Tax=Ciceribacter azotifigens TaxID=2069303 RepID=UPI003A8B6BC3
MRKIEKKYLRVVGALRRFLGLQYRSPLDEQDVFQLVRDRRVALVGNSRALSGTTFGAEIDAHDLVVRFNSAPIPSAASHGSRTDVIATSIELEKSIMAERGASHLFWMSPPRNALQHWIVRWPFFFLYPRESHKVLCARADNRPTTGLMVIELLSRSPCKSVDLYGFDFYESGSLSGGQTKATSPHDYDTEEDFVSRLMVSDKRFALHRADPDG